MAVVNVTGLRELRSAFHAAGAELGKEALKRANKSGAQRVVDEALPHVPIRSGRLRSSVRALASQREGRAVAGTARVPYAAAIHWGRKNGGFIEARPFLYEAAKRAEDEIVKDYERDIGDIFDRLVR